MIIVEYIHFGQKKKSKLLCERNDENGSDGQVVSKEVQQGAATIIKSHKT